MQNGLRIAFRVALTLTVVLVLAQLYYLLAWLVTPGGNCDFPGDCLNTAFPRAFRTAERLWVLTNVAGLATLCLAVARQSPWRSVLRLGCAGLVAAGAYLLSSWARFDDPALWLRFGDPSAPTAFGGIDWWAVALLLGSLVMYGWDVVRRPHQAQAPELAVADSAAR